MWCAASNGPKPEGPERGPLDRGPSIEQGGTGKFDKEGYNLRAIPAQAPQQPVNTLHDDERQMGATEGGHLVEVHAETEEQRHHLPESLTVSPQPTS